MQEQNYISDEWVRYLLPQKDFEVGPQYLREEPHAYAERHQSPEELGFLVARADIREYREGSAKKQQALREVAKSRQANASGRQ